MGSTPCGFLGKTKKPSQGLALWPPPRRVPSKPELTLNLRSNFNCSVPEVSPRNFRPYCAQKTFLEGGGDVVHREEYRNHKPSDTDTEKDNHGRLNKTYQRVDRIVYLALIKFCERTQDTR